MLTEGQIKQYETDGVIMLSGVFVDWVDRLRGATERVLTDDVVRNTGGFSRNRDMWMRDPDFRAFAFESPAAEVARQLMRSETARLYFDHLFVKEPGTEAPTPWHQDMPYWPAKGGQIASVWVTLDDVTRESSGLVYVRGSHQAGKAYKPVGFSDGNVKEGSDGEGMPDIDADPGAFDLLSWNMKPGDCLVHHPFAIHGASGNTSISIRRRALSTRWADENVRYDPRPGSDQGLLDPALEPGGPLAGDRFPLMA